MSTSESSLNEILVGAEDLPSLAKKLPAGYDVSFFMNCAQLPAPRLRDRDIPKEVVDLFDDDDQDLFAMVGHLFSTEAEYKSAVVHRALLPLIKSSFASDLVYNLLRFGNNVAPDGVVELPIGEKQHFLKLILEFKSPASESGGGRSKAEDLDLQIGQAFAYAKYAYLNKFGNKHYDFASTVYHRMTLSS